MLKLIITVVNVGNNVVGGYNVYSLVMVVKYVKVPARIRNTCSCGICMRDMINNKTRQTCADLRKFDVNPRNSD